MRNATSFFSGKNKLQIVGLALSWTEEEKKIDDALIGKDQKKKKEEDKCSICILLRLTKTTLYCYPFHCYFNAVTSIFILYIYSYGILYLIPI